MNLPNKITVFRIIIIPIFMIFAFPYPKFMQGMVTFIPEIVRASIVFALFLIGTISDFVDGKIARKYDLVTDFGKFLDPIADKLLVSAALTALCVQRPIYAWVLMVTLIREFVVTGMRLVASNKGVVIAAGKLGKMKTTFQTLGLCVLFAAPIIAYFLPKIEPIVRWTGDITMAVSVVFLIISGIQYIVKSAYLLEGSM